ncbi:S9 family peptidase [Stenotrophomonas mori]|uniref:Prolyl oligopeptidase family serine peptidase n=1 Tax=Stenotrophomonas mori TaxID=2871096 RepID=A0ABT0SK34_9GAMM|nr:prolyl oligopeptidase family serine peptidase [Stenotrophomonas mori]MCL7715694.1 prolyl oligopeptidase family serine peptidase [Stenotrophomonas mori]
MNPAIRGLAAAVFAVAGSAAAAIPVPPAIHADGVPALPDATAEASARYLEFRRASFLGWDPQNRSVLMKTRFGGTDQLHSVRAPGGARTQLSFEAEPVPFASHAPGGSGHLVVQKDVGGNEFYQLYTLKDGQLQLLTDGRSRNWFGSWSRDGRLLGYASSRRNGADMDLYVLDPAVPGSDRRVAQVSGGGWNISDFSADGTRALAVNRMSINEGVVAEIDLRKGGMKVLTPARGRASYGDARYAGDGSIWVLSNRDADFVRLGKLDPRTGRFTAVSAEPRWDVTDYAVSDDERMLVYAINDAGVSRVRVADGQGGNVRPVEGLPDGVLDWSFGQLLQIAPWGEIGLSLSSAKVPGDVYSIDPQTLAVRRWTASEAGGLDLERNREPEQVEIASFDGERISGFLYRPDPARFPGKRPLIMDIHGGPEGQSRPGFLGADNYLINELGVALFLPNVRGSSGYGTRFLDLDNGPWKREDSVKDVGAFIDALAGDPGLDAARFAVYGFSYGGYMCYASAVHYSDRLRSASCAVAISDFVTFLENTQAYRRDLRRVEYGDERDPAQRARLAEISPLRNVAKIGIPLMVATGGNDPRVPASEAEQIVAALRAQGGEAWHVLARNEGHGFHKRENRDFIFWAGVEFWKKTLLDPPAAD